MAGEEPWSVTIKVALYLFDLISDWVNGGLMIHGGPPRSNLTEDGLKPSCGTGDQAHHAWGTLAIALSWLPAILSLAYLAQVINDKGGALLAPLRFILWPILVPILMINTGLLKRNPRWILGVEINYTAVLLCKHFEGLLEAAPQLTLQMYIIIKTGICTQELKGWITLCSMAISLITLVMTSIDANFLHENMTVKRRFGLYLKLSGLFIPNIIFKTGSVALTFASFKYFGVLYFVLFAAAWGIFLILMGNYDFRSTTGFLRSTWLVNFVATVSLNTLTVFLYGDTKEEDLILTRGSCWMGLAINSVSLVAMYTLDADKIYLSESHLLIRERLDLIVFFMLCLGLFNCFLTEIYIKLWPGLLFEHYRGTDRAATTEN